MPCPEYRDSIALLVDGELSQDAATGVRGHVAGCNGCSSHVQELEALIAQLTPAPPAGMTVEESRFWRRFDADLAVRVARGETPFWRQSFALPFPIAAAGLATVVALSVVTYRVQARAERLAERSAQLEASLRTLQEDTLFGASAVAAAAAAPFERRLGAQEAAVTSGRVNEVVPYPRAATAPLQLRSPNVSTVPDARAKSASSDLQIRFVDSNDGNLY